METLKRILEEHPFFEGLEQAHLELITGCAANAVFKEGTIIFREGDDADRFYVIRDGRVALDLHAPARDAIIIDTVEQGEILGASWLFPPYRWNFDARVLRDVRALSLDGKCLRGKCEEDPRLGYELMKRFALIVAERLQATRLRLLDIYGSPSSRQEGVAE